MWDQTALEIMLKDKTAFEIYKIEDYYEFVLALEALPTQLYSAHLSKLSDSDRVIYAKQYLDTFWQAFPTVDVAANEAAPNVIFEALRAIYYAENHAQENSALINQLALLKKNPIYGEILSELILSDKNISPNPDNKKLSEALMIEFSQYSENAKARAIQAEAQKRQKDDEEYQRRKKDEELRKKEKELRKKEERIKQEQKNKEAKKQFAALQNGFDDLEKTSKKPEGALNQVKAIAANPEEMLAKDHGKLLINCISPDEALNIKIRNQVHHRMCEVLRSLLPHNSNEQFEALLKHANNRNIALQIINANHKTATELLSEAIKQGKPNDEINKYSAYNLAIVSLKYKLFHASNPNPMIQVLLSEVSDTLPPHLEFFLMKALKETVNADQGGYQFHIDTMMITGMTIWFAAECVNPDSPIQLLSDRRAHFKKHFETLDKMINKVKLDFLASNKMNMSNNNNQNTQAYVQKPLRHTPSKQKTNSIVDVFKGKEASYLANVSNRDEIHNQLKLAVISQLPELSEQLKILSLEAILKITRYEQAFKQIMYDATIAVKSQAKAQSGNVATAARQYMVLADFQFRVLDKFSPVMSALLATSEPLSKILNTPRLKEKLFENMEKALQDEAPYQPNNAEDFSMLMTHLMSLVNEYGSLSVLKVTMSSNNVFLKKMLDDRVSVQLLLDQFNQFYDKKNFAKSMAYKN